MCLLSSLLPSCCVLLCALLCVVVLVCIMCIVCVVVMSLCDFALFCCRFLMFVFVSICC